jgi:hypothetical protein
MNIDELLAAIHAKHHPQGRNCSEYAEAEHGKGGAEDPMQKALEKLESVLKNTAPLGELEAALPPAARYLGPGAWIQAIKIGNSVL